MNGQQVSLVVCLALQMICLGFGFGLDFRVRAEVKNEREIGQRFRLPHC